MRAAILIVSLLACGRVAHAQWMPNTRHGLWIGLGLGDGSARIDCTYFCDSGREDAFSGYIRVGGSLSPHVLLGGEANGWTTGVYGDRLGAASLIAMWYPRRNGASYLKFGAGVMGYRTAFHDDATQLSVIAPSASLGVGYEVRIEPRVSLVPWINVLASPRVDLHYRLGFTNPPPSRPDVSINLIQAGLGITRH